MANFVVKCLEWLFLRLHGMFCGHKLWNCCEEEYKTYFVVWNGFGVEYMACIIVRILEFLFSRIHIIYCCEECEMAVRKNTWNIMWLRVWCEFEEMDGIFYGEKCGVAVRWNTFLILWIGVWSASGEKYIPHFLMKSVDCLLGRNCGIFCGEEFGELVRKNICLILFWRLWSVCEEKLVSYFVVSTVGGFAEGYMVYFVGKSVSYLWGIVHVIFCWTVWSGREEDYMVYFWWRFLN